MTMTKKPRRMARQAPESQASATGPSSSPLADIATTPKRSTKQDVVLDLLSGEGGVPLSAIVMATGWLPHTARAALTGLRKKGHAISRIKVEGETRYTVAAGPAQ